MTAPDQPLVIKSLKPDDWPERLYGGKAIVRFPSGVESGSWYNRPDADVEKTREYVRADLTRTPLAEALVVPEVAALVYAAKMVMHDLHHGNGLEGLYANRDRLDAALRAIGGDA